MEHAFLLADSIQPFAIGDLARNPMAWAIILGAMAVYALIPRNTKISRAIGVTCGAISVGLFLIQMPVDAAISGKVVFWICSIITVSAAVATISMRSPVYSAIWFALTLVGVSGLLLFQGAQFLGLATIVVYAGAIVVTFLFVVMLAQPDGHSTYDRITWGHFPRTFAVTAAALLVALITFAIGKESHTDRIDVAAAIAELEVDDLPLLRSDQVTDVRIGDTIVIDVRSDVSDETMEALQAGLPDKLAEHVGWAEKPLIVERLATTDDVLHPAHMAHLGAQLFGRHLLSVELAGTLLLVALVGAVSIVIQGRNSSLEEEPEAP